VVSGGAFDGIFFEHATLYPLLARARAAPDRATRLTRTYGVSVRNTLIATALRIGLTRELVLAPLGLEDSSYEQPPSSRLADRAAVGHPWHLRVEHREPGLARWPSASAHRSIALFLDFLRLLAINLCQSFICIAVCPQEFIKLCVDCLGGRGVQRAE
jgi:hypothetical protein